MVAEYVILRVYYFTSLRRSLANSVRRSDNTDVIRLSHVFMRFSLTSLLLLVLASAIVASLGTSYARWRSTCRLQPISDHYFEYWTEHEGQVKLELNENGEFLLDSNRGPEEVVAMCFCGRIKRPDGYYKGSGMEIFLALTPSGEGLRVESDPQFTPESRMHLDESHSAEVTWTAETIKNGAAVTVTLTLFREKQRINTEHSTRKIMRPYRDPPNHDAE